MNAATDTAGTRASDPTMLDMRGGASVTCGDTHVGTVAGVVTTPRGKSPRVTALVVRDLERMRPWHPVGLTDVDAATADRVELTVSPGALRRRTFPTRVIMVEDIAHDPWSDLEIGSLSGIWMPPEPPVEVPVTVPRLEPGEVLLPTGVHVYACGQRAGRLQGFHVDGATGRLTEIIVAAGHRPCTHRVVVQAQAVDEVSETAVWLTATRKEVLQMPAADEYHQQHELIPEEPHEAGVTESEPDAAHVEAARVLADEAEEELRSRGFTDDEIRHWAESYYREHRSGDVETFLAWIELREHQR